MVHFYITTQVKETKNLVISELEKDILYRETFMYDDPKAEVSPSFQVLITEESEVFISINREDFGVKTYPEITKDLYHHYGNAVLILSIRKQSCLCILSLMDLCSWILLEPNVSMQPLPHARACTMHLIKALHILGYTHQIWDVALNKEM